ncbi:MAG: hypothetical protein U9P72_08230, partial [Campylobacterota bacterium]|nr:hypothetical protein [Campylobacterota bacterium]
MKFLFALFILLGLVACGVDTDSSGVPSDVPVTPDPDEPEPDEPDSDEPEPDEPEPDKPDPDEPEPDDPEPIFESDGAVYDENACKSSWATAIPLQDHNENDDRESSDDANGIAV